MRRSFRVLIVLGATFLGAVAATAGLAQRGGAQLAPVPSRAQVRAETGTAKVYDTSVLHRIEVVMSAEDAASIINRTEQRVRCTFTFDGLALHDVGVRQSGGVYHPYQPITNKPSLSIKFDEFVKGQTLFGLDKVVLKNELQDMSLVNEHLTYDVFRRAGIAAPMTAHARVTINGIDSGIYLLREPIDKDFLVRNFGDASGNLYEIENTRDFVFDPNYPALDDEGKNGRNRSGLVRFAEAIRATTPATFVADLSPYVDIDRLVTYAAAEAATLHWDGLTYRNNNSYVYARPSDGKFIFIPYGADQAFNGPRMNGNSSLAWPRSTLVQRLVAVPRFADRFSAEVIRIGREPVWNQRALSERLDRVARILATAETSGRTGRDVARFTSYRAAMDGLIRAGGSVLSR
ncbi:MAG: CotH kinase family protein [Acidobacteriota bacterium]